ncbi:DUF4245 family protein [Microbacterium phosphatis]|uniref:DUF4245 family protein n=1 Tax=Microbacterium phosphatis TaxID=3140248 RepID=UPI003140A6D3
MARAQGEPRIVAELGRPETPEETAARKAANTQAYRGSKNVRNLLVALAVTVAIVVVMFLIVPRGDLPEQASIAPGPVAAEAAKEFGTVLVPALPGEAANWRINAAEVVPGDPASWEIVYVPEGDGFLRFAQGFEADETWAARKLGGTTPSDEVEIGGLTWQVYDVDPEDNGNVAHALGTQAGADHILLYGSTSAALTAEVAEMIAPQVRALAEEQE